MPMTQTKDWEGMSKKKDIVEKWLIYESCSQSRCMDNGHTVCIVLPRMLISAIIMMVLRLVNIVA